MSATPPSVARKTTTQVFPLGANVPNDTIASGEMPMHRRGPSLAGAVLVLGGVASAAALVPVTTSNASAPQMTAVSLMTQALQNAVASGGVHEDSVARNGGFSIHIVDDIGATQGRQVFTMSNGGTYTLLAFDTKKIAYERANAKGLTFFQMTKHPATYANEWLVHKPSDPSYVSTVFATWLASDFTQYRLIGPLTLGPVTMLQGREVRTISGTAPRVSNNPSEPATMYVTVTGTVLPVSLREKGGNGTFDVTWSKWGEHVALLTPSPTVPYPTS